MITFMWIAVAMIGIGVISGAITLMMPWDMWDLGKLLWLVLWFIIGVIGLLLFIVYWIIRLVS